MPYLVSTLDLLMPMTQGAEISSSSSHTMLSNIAKRNLIHISVVSFGTRSHIYALIQ